MIDFMGKEMQRRGQEKVIMASVESAVTVEQVQQKLYFYLYICLYF